MVKCNPGRVVWLVGVLMVAFASVGLACKYSVRDVGFVDLAEDSFDLHLLLSEQNPESMARDARTIATATFLESNLSLEVAHLGSDPEHPSRQMAAEHGAESFPFAFLRSPGGRALPIDLSSGSGAELVDDDLWSLMEKTVSSPKREWLLANLLDAFAVIVLLESTDSDQNQAAHMAIEGAIDSIKELMPKMPKPVETPPAVLKIGAADRAGESILLWSLGFDLDLEDEPQAAIVIGRGRRLGPPLQGGLITRTKLQQMMALIGQDCECDLDRSWMQGPMVPLRWDSDQQKRAYDKLAFDPESPLVKAEISRILARGPNARGVTGGKSPAAMEAMFLGYSEEFVDAVRSTPSETLATTEPKPEASGAVNEPEKMAVDASEATEPIDPIEVAEVSAVTVEVADDPGSEDSGLPIPLTWITVLVLGGIALVGGAIVIVRGSGF